MISKRRPMSASQLRQSGLHDERLRGTVVTGTLISGRVTVGEEVEVSPVGLRAKVRGLQIHNRAVESAEAGQRTAVNLQGVDRAVIERGYLLTAPGALVASRRLDCVYRHLAGAGRNLKNRTIVRFHTGTSEVMARIILLDRDELEPGGEGYCQIILAAPLAAVAGDRFVMRDSSPVTTIGGGMIVDPLPAKHRRSAEAVLAEFRILAGGEQAARAAVVDGAGRDGRDHGEQPRRADGNPSGRAPQASGRDVFRAGGLSGRPGRGAGPLGAGVRRAPGEDLRGTGGVPQTVPPQGRAALREELRTTLGMGDGAGQKISGWPSGNSKGGGLVAEKEHVRMAGHRGPTKGEMGDLRGKLHRALSGEWLGAADSGGDPGALFPTGKRRSRASSGS